MSTIIAPSILSADFSKLGEEVQSVDQAGADWIHVDVMDGHFVPNITIGPLVVEAVRKVTQKPLDVHLMIENPERYIEAFVQAGANWVSVHQEEGYHLDRTIQLIKSFGAKAGIALNPATAVDTVFPLLNQLDYVLIMTVNPGFGGQKFIPYCLDKVRRLRDQIKKENLPTKIQVDGGVNSKTIADVKAAGAEIFVAGSAVFGANDYQQAILELRGKADGGQ
ncbi:MAG: ribulose-phosphate 3-epimerase [Deltaproteobacteria bacterium]|nr:ribulose-phosphate 3-epimerase [Deltaproteobacteria bacterium]